MPGAPPQDTSFIRRLEQLERQVSILQRQLDIERKAREFNWFEWQLGVMQGQLTPDGSAPGDIWRVGSSGPEVSGRTGETFHDWLLDTGQTIESGRRVVVAKHRQTKRHYVIAAQCPTPGAEPAAFASAVSDPLAVFSTAPTVDYFSFPTWNQTSNAIIDTTGSADSVDFVPGYTGTTLVDISIRIEHSSSINNDPSVWALAFAGEQLASGLLFATLPQKATNSNLFYGATVDDPGSFQVGVRLPDGGGPTPATNGTATCRITITRVLSE